MIPRDVGAAPRAFIPAAGAPAAVTVVCSSLPQRPAGPEAAATAGGGPLAVLAGSQSPASVAFPLRRDRARRRPRTEPLGGRCCWQRSMRGCCSRRPQRQPYPFTPPACRKAPSQATPHRPLAGAPPAPPGPRGPRAGCCCRPPAGAPHHHPGGRCLPPPLRRRGHKKVHMHRRRPGVAAPPWRRAGRPGPGGGDGGDGDAAPPPSVWWRRGRRHAGQVVWRLCRRDRRGGPRTGARGHCGCARAAGGEVRVLLFHDLF